MAAITNPGTNVTEFSGEYKMLALAQLSITTASEAITLSYAENGITEITTIVGGISGGCSTTFSYLETSFSGLVVTVASFVEAGTASTGWGSATVDLLIIGK
jgi:hypothetical protein